jgi:hypothetical protein
MITGDPIGRRFETCQEPVADPWAICLESVRTRRWRMMRIWAGSQRFAEGGKAVDHGTDDEKHEQPRSHALKCDALAQFKHLSRDQALAEVDFRGADRVLLNDFVFVEKNHERLLIARGAAVNQIHIGNKACRLRVQSGEFIFP